MDTKFDNFLNENSDFFEMKKSEIINKMDSLMKEYYDFTMLISSKNWRTSGTVYQNLREAKELISVMKEGSKKEIEYMIQNDKDFDIEEYKKLYPEQYKKLFNE